MVQAINNWPAYSVGAGTEAELADYVNIAKDKSAGALTFIAAIGTSTPIKKVAVAPMLVAATALRLQIIKELLDGSTSATHKTELVILTSDLQGFVAPFANEIEKGIKIEIIAVEDVGPTVFHGNYLVTLSFVTTGTNPEISGTTLFSSILSPL